MTNTPQYVKLFNVASDFEGAAATLGEISDVLQLFKELLWDAAEFLDPEKPYTTQHFKSRFHLLHSMLCTVEGSLQQTTTAILSATDRAYEAAQSERKEDPNADS